MLDGSNMSPTGTQEAIHLEGCRIAAEAAMRQGWVIASFTTKQSDFIVLAENDPDATSASVTVIARATDDWEVDLANISIEACEGDTSCFVVFVDLSHAESHCYVMPDTVLGEQLYEAYRETQGAVRSRLVRRKERLTVDHELVEPWRDRWDVIATHFERVRAELEEGDAS